MQKMSRSPGSLAGGPGVCTSLHVETSNYSRTGIKTYALPLKVTRELTESIKRRYPIEGAVLDLMLLDGRAVLVDQEG